MSDLKNVKDFEDEDLPEVVRRRVAEFVARGHDRAHLSFNPEGTVFLDTELIDSAAFEEIILNPRLYPKRS